MDGTTLNGITGEDPDRPADPGLGGRDLQRANIAAARAVGEMVRTTLGPRGMDKLLVDDAGMGIVTNNGASILREKVDHPAADLVAEVALSQEEEVGDGTTTAAMLAGELLGEAGDLVERGVHPTTVAEGYLRAADRALDALDDLAVDVDAEDADALERIASTAMTGKATMDAGDRLAELVVEAVLTVADGGGVDVDDVTVEKMTGGRVADSRILDGVVVGKERADNSCPFRVEDADVALVDKPIELRELGADATHDVSTPADLERLIEGERARVVEVVDHLDDLGVDAVICGENVAELPRSIMAERDMYVARRVDGDDVALVARATGATVVGDPGELGAEDLGRAGVVEERNIDGDRKTTVEDCADARAVTLALHGATMNVLDEVHRAVEDALDAVAATLTDSAVLPGGGAGEMAAALALREEASRHDGREQLAIEAFADALDVVPRTLAENAGVDPVDAVVDLRAAQATGARTAGLDGETGEVVDALDAGLVEPLVVKRRAVECAVEAAVTVLRIDGVLPKRDEFEDEETGPPAGAGPGAPGMGGPGGPGAGGPGMGGPGPT